MIDRVTGIKEIEDFMQEQFRLGEQVIIETLAYVGQLCVNHARSVPAQTGFKDQTGNLRSSMGYAIVKDGRVLSTSNFEVVKKGKKGQKTGMDLVKELANGMSGINLIVVAGMNYAFYLEAYHNRDVLASSELLAEKEVPRMLKELGFAI